jgi:hypothetical protein
MYIVIIATVEFFWTMDLSKVINHAAFAILS